MISSTVAARSGTVALSCLLAAAAAACAAGAGPVKHMREVASVNTVPGAEDAVVVFVRPKHGGSAEQWSVFEVEEKKPATLVGILAAMKKVAYRTSPGRHLFMAVGAEADFMAANLEAGKLYYVVVMADKPTWGANFSLQPVRAAEHAQLAARLAETSWVETTDDSLAWARDHAEDIEAKRFKYYGIWRRKPSFERLALFPDDGK
jgi:hypothetical protein